MIKNGLLQTLVSLLTLGVYGQHTLTLDVSSLADTAKVILKADTKVIYAGDSIPFVDTNFNIAITPNGLNFIVKFQTASPISDTIIYIKAATMLAVRNCMINGNSFGFAPITTILIEQEDMANTKIKEYSNLKFPKPSSDSSNSTQTNIPGLTPHHVGSSYYDAVYLEGK